MASTESLAGKGFLIGMGGGGGNRLAVTVSRDFVSSGVGSGEDSTAAAEVGISCRSGWSGTCGFGLSGPLSIIARESCEMGRPACIQAGFTARLKGCLGAI